MEQFNKLNQPSRLKSLDILRGAIMVLMAIDHVRVYAGVPAGSAEPAIFFTRWVTHFCAPGFVFFTGVSAFLYEQKVKSKNELSKFLLTRGLLLVVLELTVIRYFWTFNLNFSNFTLAGVIWMIGWCMIIMAALVRLNPMSVGIIGVLIIGTQQAFIYIPNLFPSIAKYWEFIYTSGWEGESAITILYVIVPWIGVLAAGYGIGMVFLKNENQRNKICWWIGGISISLFLIIASFIAYKNPSGELSFPLQVLNQKKYPASQLYLLMTLGPLIVLIPYAEKARGWLINVLSIFGKVPMFYYLLHILVIHISALLVNMFLFHQTNAAFYSTAPFTRIDPQYKWSLLVLYFVFLVDVIILYFACKWYVKIKSGNKYTLLKYL
jgi:uncharacterized membrane protein